MGLFSCFKKKKDADDIRESIKNFILNYMEVYCKANPRNVGSAVLICVETVRCVYAFSNEKIIDAMKTCNVSVEDAALSLIQLNAKTYIKERLKLEEDVAGDYKFYEAVINERYERGLISKDQYEADLSYGNRLKGDKITNEKMDKKMSEKVKLWWVGTRDEQGRKMPRKLSCSKKEVIKFAEENGLNPPEEYIPDCEFEFQIWKSLVSTQRQRLEDVEKSCIRKHPPEDALEMYKKRKSEANNKKETKQ